MRKPLPELRRRFNHDQTRSPIPTMQPSKLNHRFLEKARRAPRYHRLLSEGVFAIRMRGTKCENFAVNLEATWLDARIVKDLLLIPKRTLPQVDH